MDDVALPSFRELNMFAFKLPVIAIYFNTSDYPNKYIARVFESLPTPIPKRYILIKDTLSEIETDIIENLNMILINRDSTDDPHIIECFI